MTFNYFSMFVYIYEIYTNSFSRMVHLLVVCISIILLGASVYICYHLIRNIYIFLKYASKIETE